VAVAAAAGGEWYTEPNSEKTLGSFTSQMWLMSMPGSLMYARLSSMKTKPMPWRTLRARTSKILRDSSELVSYSAKVLPTAAAWSISLVTTPC
jgi:hypothetical protein